MWIIKKELDENTNAIKALCRATCHNFIEIGRILTEIKEKGIFLQKYKTFTEYLISEDFEFSEQHAYRLIDINQKFGSLLQSEPNLGLVSYKKLLAIAHVPDKEIREEMALKTALENTSFENLDSQVKTAVFDTKHHLTEKLYSDIHRKAQRETQNLEVDYDDPKLKCIRHVNSILRDIETLTAGPLKDIRIRIDNWLIFADRFKTDTDVQKYKGALLVKIQAMRK